MSLETMTKLLSTTVGSGGTSSITFSNIPQNYTDLSLRLSLRDSASGGYDNILITVNGATTGYTERWMWAYNDTNTQSSTATTNSSIRTSFMPGATATASTFGIADVYFSNYSNFSPKEGSIDFVTESKVGYTVWGVDSFLQSSPAPITSITISGLNGNFVQYSTATLYGMKTANQTAKAIGGDRVIYDGTYFIHTYTTSGTFTPKQPLTVEYLVIAGGGGGAAVSSGGNYGAPGGGAGGYRSSIGSESSGGGAVSEAKLPVSTNTLNVLVGAGGAGNVQGTDSIFGNIVSIGGGYAPVGNGGSGGGGFDFSPYLTPGSGTSGQGYAGGAAVSATSPGGGGGAGGVGSTARTGGAGVTSSVTGAAVARAGGGGGGWGGTATAGGGNGGAAGSAGNGSAGTANTGGGGGGATAIANTRSGGAGGSGIVIIRYKE